MSAPNVSSDPPGISSRQILTAAMASSFGWALDLFDLFILLYVAPLIGRLFFPSTRPMLSLAAVYASFAVTLLMRPVGSALFGSYADKHGRKGAMIVAVVGVGVSTALFGALPTDAQIGAAAAVIFIVLRLVQGIFVGGVVASTHTIGTESVPARWRGAMSGMVSGGGSGLGALLASITFYVATTLFPGGSFEVWGWRFMFFCGIISSFLGVFIFLSLEESPIWIELKLRRTRAKRSDIEESPLRTLFSRRWLPVMAVNLLLTIGSGAGYYLTMGFLPTFLKVVVKAPDTSASLILIAASVIAIVACVAVGHLSTLIGRRRTFRIFGVLRVILLPSLVLVMAGTNNVAIVATAALLLCLIGNASYAHLVIFLNERFPTALRATGTGLSWNLGFAIGGIMPTLVSLAAGVPQNLPIALAIFLFGVSLLYLIGAIVTPETRNQFTI
ncbi:MAG TPA: MFS transporter [Stellaceae bacterium]|nr:MFS transporter [Stellaceae bacterium]